MNYDPVQFRLYQSLTQILSEIAYSEGISNWERSQSHLHLENGNSKWEKREKYKEKHLAYQNSRYKAIGLYKISHLAILKSMDESESS